MFGSAKKRFHWYESWAFAQVRARSRPMKAKELLYFFVFIAMLSLAIAAWVLHADGPDARMRTSTAVAFAIGFAVLLTASLPLLHRLPGYLYIDDAHFIVGKTATRFFDVESAHVGTLWLEGRTWRVLTYRTRGVETLIGLADDIDAQALASYLRAVGIPERPGDPRP